MNSPTFTSPIRSKMVMVRFNEEDHTALLERAKHENMPVSTLCYAIIKKELNSFKTINFTGNKEGCHGK